MQLLNLLLIAFFTLSNASESDPYVDRIGLHPDPIPLNSFLHRFNRHKMLMRARQCEAMYSCEDPHESCEDLTARFKINGLIKDDDEVIFKVWRHGEISSLVIKTGDNKFSVLFSGTKDNSKKDRKADAKMFQKGLKMRRIYGNVKVHDGFFLAIQDFWSHFFGHITPYLDSSKPVLVQITGHSLGGALAQLAGLHVKAQMHKHFNMPKEFINLQLVTFGGACAYGLRTYHKIEEIIGQENAINIYCKNDWAVEASQLVGLQNPGFHLILENPTAVPFARHAHAHHIVRLVPTIREWTNRGLLAFNEACKPSRCTYPKWSSVMSSFAQASTPNPIQPARARRVHRGVVLDEAEMRRRRKEMKIKEWRRKQREAVEKDKQKIERDFERVLKKKKKIDKRRKERRREERRNRTPSSSSSSYDSYQDHSTSGSSSSSSYDMGKDMRRAARRNKHEAKERERRDEKRKGIKRKQKAWDKKWEEVTLEKIENHYVEKRGLGQVNYPEKLGKRPRSMSTSSSSSLSSSLSSS